MRCLISILLAVLVSGCAGGINTYKEDPVLPEDHAWLIMTVQTVEAGASFEFASAVNSYRTPKYGEGSTVKMMALPVGDYRLSAYYIKALRQAFEHPETHSQKFGFKIEPGVINYIGHFGVSDRFYRSSVIVLRPRFDAITEILSSEYPELNKKYELKYTHISQYSEGSK